MSPRVEDRPPSPPRAQNWPPLLQALARVRPPALLWGASAAVVALEYLPRFSVWVPDAESPKWLATFVLAGSAAHVLLRAARAPSRFLRRGFGDIVVFAVVAVLGAFYGVRVAATVAALRNLWLVGRDAASRGRLARFVERLVARPMRLLAASFAFLIALGTLALMAPVSTADGLGAPPLVALFTATSATCVTGLTVVDTAGYFSGVGQAIVLALIQVGGLGIMTLTSALALAFGSRLSPRLRGAMLEILDEGTLSGFRRLVAVVVLSTLAFEALGAAALYPSFTEDAAGQPLTAGQRVFFAVFHAVSAFCNAGFALYPDSLARFATSVRMSAVVSGLVVVGGLGFPVLLDLGRGAANRPGVRGLWWRLTAHTKLVLVATPVLVFGAAAVFLAFEWTRSLGHLPPPAKVLAAVFQSVNFRTAGFSPVDLGQMAPAVLLVAALTMFIGGAPSSVAGGVKTTTVATLFIAVRALMRGQPEVTVFGRSISPGTIQRAMAVLVLSCAILFVGTVSLVALEPNLALDALLFEATSAFATVGLSTGLTPGLGAPAKLLLVVLMFVGRLGPLAVALTIGRARAADYSFPKARILVG